MKRLLLLLLISVPFIFASCDSDDDSINISQKSLSFSANDTKVYEVSVSSPYEVDMLYISWINVEKIGDDKKFTLKISVNENKGGELRTGSVSFSKKGTGTSSYAPEWVGEIKVTQAAN